MEWIEKSRQVPKKQNNDHSNNKTAVHIAAEDNDDNIIVNNANANNHTNDDDIEFEPKLDNTNNKRVVLHDANQFKDGAHVLILKDQPILNKNLDILDTNDELINVSLVEADVVTRNKLRKNKTVLSDEAENILLGTRRAQTKTEEPNQNDNYLLPQYNDETERFGLNRKGFVIDDNHNVLIENDNKIDITNVAIGNKKLYDANYKLQFQHDFYNEDEMNTLFKKKQKNKNKNKLKKKT